MIQISNKRPYKMFAYSRHPVDHGNHLDRDAPPVPIIMPDDEETPGFRTDQDSFVKIMETENNGCVTVCAIINRQHHGDGCTGFSVGQRLVLPKTLCIVRFTGNVMTRSETNVLTKGNDLFVSS